jgi:hypothetical protein
MRVDGQCGIGGQKWRSWPPGSALDVFPSPPTSNNETSLFHLPVLLTPADASNLVEVMAWQSSAVPTPFILISPTMATFFPMDFGLLDLEHDATAPSDGEAHLHTVKDTAPCTTPKLMGNIGPKAAYSLQAILDNSFKLTLGWHLRTVPMMRRCISAT